MAPYEQQRQQLIDRAMRLWNIYAENYRTNPLKYQFMLAAKRELGISPLNKIKKEVLAEYPEIPFLRITSEIMAARSLEQMRLSSLRYLVEQITNMVSYHFAYCTIQSRIVEFTYELKHYQLPKSQFGIDPNKCKCKSNRIRNRYVPQDS